jgi:sirohydrochlorin ferrochelatase
VPYSSLYPSFEFLARTSALTLLLTCSGAPVGTEPARTAQTGVLLLAHGGKDNWNQEVQRVAETVNATLPTEVAFGMADRTAIQTAVDRLSARGVNEIVAVPLFVSSHSTVITATEYLLGLRATAPKELAIFARMRHGSGDAHQDAAGQNEADHTADHAAGHHPDSDHAAGDAPPTPDGTDADRMRPVDTTLPIRMTGALDRHAAVGAILLDRARSISHDPHREAVVLVAHGPVSEDANRGWLADMGVLAATVETGNFARVEYLTLRDDAPPPIWEKAKAALRSRVEVARADGLEVLIVPHLLSFGGIEEGLRARLEGLEYRMTAQGLLPDERLAGWVLEMAGSRSATGRISNAR